MAIVDIAVARDAFGNLLVQVFLLPVVVLFIGGLLVALIKFAGPSIGELWRRSRSQFVALSVFAVCVTISIHSQTQWKGFRDEKDNRSRNYICFCGQFFTANHDAFRNRLVHVHQ